MRFHLVDRIESWESMRHITASKVTSVYEDYWQPTASGSLLPFGMALEALCQAGTWLVLLSSEHTKRAALLTVGEVSMHRDLRPGDILRMHVEVVSADRDAAVVDGRIEVDGAVVLEASTIMCALIDAENLDDPADTRALARQLLGQGAPR
ncbi:3-hydroxylacyl-ACP dehydratase [Nocardia transvalensis]|uniref:3-hydroxylacyl-ACP dehydratase n=1 Tax=Nocardia transvalensis TaxID=37333 RepID=UPI001895056A|nr:3-hydroxylacyl-ACP dehydratase [Nocardia transvalensis]MBF6329922.1 3-hydroxylacyl-ACP dehydratase [Nocardia transvalensis]